MNKYFRFKLRGREFGKWRPYTAAAFIEDCQTWADNDCPFEAEFAWANSIESLAK